MLSKQNSQSRQPSYETLDPRQLMTADLSPVNGVLVVDVTENTDELSFEAGPEFHALSINGVVTNIAADEVQEIRFYGGHEDTIAIQGRADEADRFSSWENYSLMKSKGLTVKAYGFGNVDSQSTGSVEDRAYLFGTEFVDNLEGSPSDVALTRPETVTTVQDYDRVYIYAKGGNDLAWLEDSEGDDRFMSRNSTDVLQAPDAYLRLTDFESVEVNAQNGGADRAYQRGTPEDDLLILTEDIMKLSSAYRTVTVDGFERSYAYASGGDDEVRVYDSVFTDNFQFDSQFESTGERNSIDGQRELTRFYGPDFYRRAEGFYLTEAVRVSPERMAGRFSETGAVSVNMDYEAGERSDFYIEQQRRGFELIESGLATGHTQLTEVGIKMIQWGFDQQAADGGFPDSDDAVHSTTLFMRAVGQSLIRLDETSFEDFTAEMRAAWVDGLTRMSDWVIANQDLQPELNLERFSHRYFLRAVGFRQAHALTGLDRFDAQADAYFEEGITRLNEDSLLEEAGGFDLNYQSFGLRLAADYYSLTDGNVARKQMKDLFEASYAAINSRIDADGLADMSDSSRANEVGREGGTKTYDYRNAIHAFLAAHRITKRAEFFELAERTFNGARS